MDLSHDLLHRHMTLRTIEHFPNTQPRLGQSIPLVFEDHTQCSVGLHHPIILVANDSQQAILRIMHAPDGFLNAGTAIATGAISAGTIGVALKQAKHRLAEKQVPLAGIAAAFIFAAQMLNFPVVAGTTGHLLGGALAAILLGPHIGAVVVTIVVVVQALVFADGGLTALGYNVLNMAIIPAFGGYAIYLAMRRLLPKSGAGVIASTGIAAGLSVVLGAAAFSLEWLFGATAPVPFDTVFGAMVGIHLLIGIGEGLISAMALGAVMASRPDLVYGASDLDIAVLRAKQPIPVRTFLIGGFLVAVIFGAVISQFSSGNPDGLTSVAAGAGIEGSPQVLRNSLFAQYATTGIENPRISLAIAGVTGVLITLTVGFGLFSAIRAGRRTKSGPS